MKNVTLRTTAQVFHSLGFYWARWAGMYDLEDVEEIASFDTFDGQLSPDHEWKAWAAKETQLRALLGHYVLDGQISAYSGGPTCQRHTSHSLPMPCDDSIFKAPTATAWKEKMLAGHQKKPNFAQLFNSVMSQNVHVRHLGSSMTPFTACVILEGLKSLVAEQSKTGLNVIGVPSRLDISRGLGRLHTYIEQSFSKSQVAKNVILLRWHTIGIDSAIDFSWFCRALCRQYHVEQRVVGGRKTPTLDLRSWVQTPQARLALLHATSIRHMIQELPLVQTQTIHVPMAVFAAGMIYCGFLLGAVSTIAVPADCSWESVMLLDVDIVDRNVDDNLDAEVWQYFNGIFNDSQNHNNILYDVSLFSTFLRNLGQLWVRSLIVERYPERLGAPKAHALSPRSLEICRQFHLDVKKIRQLGTKRSDAYWVNFVTNLSGETIGILPYERMDVGVLQDTPEVKV
ncbi:hypothetical protein LTR67_007971 [Exophiala xenobiotica]